MPLNNTQLDNEYPPLYLSRYASGKSLPSGAVTAVSGTVSDANTAIRETAGHDPVNYDTDQRFQGDLFHRDNFLGEVIQRIINYLGQRGGFTFSLPKTSMLADTYITIGVLGDTQTSKDFDGWFVSAAQVVGATGVSVKIVNSSGTVVLSPVDVPAFTGTVANNGNIMTTELLSAATLASTLPLVSGIGLEVRVYNESGATADVSATVVMAPRVEAITPP